ncbi:PREDICTED: basic proline-rich protein-like [Priapulus caudatus]|uniref:Basic proline-rich protein-like n=1 Tax=Priapulus caudatus TaxID=37621 RepID=A0ABM1F7B8_PRICU|nr:PREDICTED: basic proline-rich protein-like [Priapulus caudatus]
MGIASANTRLAVRGGGPAHPPGPTAPPAQRSPAGPASAQRTDGVTPGQPWRIAYRSAGERPSLAQIPAGMRRAENRAACPVRPRRARAPPPPGRRARPDPGPGAPGPGGATPPPARDVPGTVFIMIAHHQPNRAAHAQPPRQHRPTAAPHGPPHHRQQKPGHTAPHARPPGVAPPAASRRNIAGIGDADIRCP